MQHQDGQSLVQASQFPSCLAYDPGVAYEVAVIVHNGLQRMYVDQEDIYFYLTLMNENYSHPDMPMGAEEGIIKGLYCFSKTAKPAKRTETRYGRKELHVAGDKSGRRKRKAPMRRRAVNVSSDGQHGFERPTAPVIREIEIPDSISVSELAQKMAIKGNEVVKALFNMGAMVTINQVIDQDTAILVVEEMGHTPKPVSAADVDEDLLADEKPTVVNKNYQGNFPRLLEVKKKYDPDNLFRLNANIAPA